jgi:hypothetical protein
LQRIMPPAGESSNPAACGSALAGQGVDGDGGEEHRAGDDELVWSSQHLANLRRLELELIDPANELAGHPPEKRYAWRP